MTDDHPHPDSPTESDCGTSPRVLVALGHADDRDIALGALRRAGHRVLAAADVEELRASLDSSVSALVVDEEFCLEALHAVVCEARSTCRVVVAVQPEAELDWLDALEAAGAAEFVSLPVVPALLCRALRPGPPAESSGNGHAGEAGNRILTIEQLERRFRTLLPVAQREEHHLGVLALTLHPLGNETGNVGEEELACAVLERVRDVFDGHGEEDGWTRPGDEILTARIGEHSYVLLVTGMRRIQDAARIAGRLTSGYLECAGGVTLDQRVGIATFPEDGTEPGILIERARRAAERVRTEGREQLAYYTESMGRWAFERLTLEKSLRDAIANGELRVHYQPRVDIQTRRIRGLEGLVRWQHPDLGLVSPGQFIPLAEETGLIVPIGEWVLREACKQNQAWREAGLAPIRVSVNLSPVQFRRPRLYETVLEVLEETGLEPDGLELELTESMLMNDPAATADTLRKLRGAGIHLSIDDFGTGYSSLSYLKRFPIDALKIDRSFVDEITTSPDNAAIATAIILMGHSLRLTVVAEGVETESQLEFLRVLKCNEIQGFLFSPPVPPEVAQQLLERESAPV